jgi:predicted phage tail component-like protein
MAVNFSFNGVTFPEISLGAAESRPFIPPLGRPVRKRDYFTTVRDFAPRTLTIPIEIRLPIKEIPRFKERIAQQWYTREPGRLIFTDEPDRVYMAILVADDMAWDETPFLTRGEVSFFCPDPLKYALQATSGVFTSGHGTILNVGSIDTNIVFNFTFRQATNELTINEGNFYIKVVHPFKIGDVLTIDTENRVVQVNGENAMTSLDFQGSKFFSLKTGYTNITTSPEGMGVLEFSYTSRWI